MAFCDFVVKYDSKIDTPEDLTKRILYSVFIKRLKAHKPVVLFLGGDSGEGKSKTSIRLQEMLSDIQDIDVRKYFTVMNVCTPLEYPQKLDKILHDKEFKKCNMICMHEARTVVSSKNWHSFVNQAIADVNAMSRAIKPLFVFIISQFIRDISNDMRYTLTHYCIVRRPRGKKARLYINVLWKDERDLEKPKLKKRKLQGYLVINGKYKRYVPDYIEMNMPSSDLVEIFDKMDYEAKTSIIRSKMNRLIDELKQDAGQQTDKVNAMVEWYSKDMDNISSIGKRYRNGWKLKPEVIEMHGLTKQEAKILESRINEIAKIKAKEVDLDA